MASDGTGRTGAALVLGLAALALAACNAPRIPPLRADVPPSTRPAPPAAAYPNINIVPSRNTKLRTSDEIEALESRLEEAGRSHVKGTRQSILASDAGS